MGQRSKAEENFMAQNGNATTVNNDPLCLPIRHLYLVISTARDSNVPLGDAASITLAIISIAQIPEGISRQKSTTWRDKT